eukprot:2980810-Amphidinium_carterae.3
MDASMQKEERTTELGGGDMCGTAFETARQNDFVFQFLAFCSFQVSLRLAKVGSKSRRVPT